MPAVFAGLAFVATAAFEFVSVDEDEPQPKLIRDKRTTQTADIDLIETNTPDNNAVENGEFYKFSILDRSDNQTS
jgi:hypothetical protein